MIAGPAESRGQSVQILNGSMTQSINYTITYVLLPQNAGNVTIGAAEIAVETVRRYKVETGSKIKVVFNVFKDLDKELYEKQLHTR